MSGPRSLHGHCNGQILGRLHSASRCLPVSIFGARRRRLLALGGGDATLDGEGGAVGARDAEGGGVASDLRDCYALDPRCRRQHGV